MTTAWRIFRIALYMIRAVFVYAWTAVFARARRGAVIDGMYRRWARMLLRTFRARLRVEGAELLPADRSAPRIFLSNHQSQLDIPALVQAADESLGFVAKKELGKIPLLAFWMRQVGCIFIDRSDRRGAHRALEESARSLREQPRALVVFPEGTRSKTGELLPVKTGGLRMALLAGAVVIPVRIRGTRGALEARVPGAPEPHDVTLRFFPPLDTRTMADDKASINALKTYVEECWNSRAMEQ